MENDIHVYLDILVQSLQKKQEVLILLLNKTTEQADLFKAEEFHVEEFEKLLNEKDFLIKELDKLNQGFEMIFDRIKMEIINNKQNYKVMIQKMQRMISDVTQLSVKIEAEEKRNSELFANYIAMERKKIKQFKVSKKTAASYYKNMANQHQQEQSYFFDKKN